MRKLLKVLIALLAVVVAAEIGFFAFLFVRHRSGAEGSGRTAAAGRSNEDAGSEDEAEEGEEDDGEKEGRDAVDSGAAAGESGRPDPQDPVYAEWAELGSAELSVRIDDAAWEIASGFLDAEGAFERDGDGLSEACDSVFAFSEVLKEAGVIQGSAKCDEGHTVSFFLNDGSTDIWIPAVKDCMAGPDRDLTVFSADALSGLAYGIITGISGESAEEAAGLVYDTPEYTGRVGYKMKAVTVDEVRRALESAADDKTRCWFWRGHGCVYTETDGTSHVGLILQDAPASGTYDLDLRGREGHLKCMAWSGKNIALGERFFTQYMQQVDGGLFFCGSCQSALADGILAAALSEKGFDAVTGASGDILTIYSDNIMRATALHLTEFDGTGHYRTIKDAFALAAEDEGESDFGKWGQRILLAQNPDREADFRIADPPQYLTAYRKQLESLMEEYKEAGLELKFGFFYLDEDTLPELFFAKANYHGAPCALYSFHDGALADLGNYGPYGTFYYHPGENRLFVSDMHMGYEYGTVNALKDGEMVPEFTFSSDEYAHGPDTETSFLINDKAVKEDAYRKQVGKVTEEDWKEAGYGSGFPLTAENLDLMMEDIAPFTVR